jgi:thioredoxin reductase (NADPH)
VLYCIRCEGHLSKGQKVAVIGASETAAQIAMMLHERYESAAALLTNGEAPAWSSDSARLLEAYGVAIHQARIVDLGSSKDALESIELEDGTSLSVRFGLVSMGLFKVYNELAVQLGAKLGDGGKPSEQRHVQIDARGETNVPNLFVIGDLAQRPDEPVMKQIYTSQEYAVRALDVVDSRMRRERRAAALVESK